MSLFSLIGRMVGTGWALAKILQRRAEVYFFFQIAKRKIEYIDELTDTIGYCFKDRTPLFSAIGWVLINNIGYPTDADGERVGAICWNVPIGITVYLEGRQFFGLGLELRPGGVLCIRQLQGVSGAIPPENLRDWPELLVRACMLHAEETHLKEVRIYKANQDFWFDTPLLQDGQTSGEAVRQHQDRVRRRYDRTAKKLGFAKKKRYYVWRVPLEAQSA